MKLKNKQQPGDGKPVGAVTHDLVNNQKRKRDICHASTYIVLNIFSNTGAKFNKTPFIVYFCSTFTETIAFFIAIHYNLFNLKTMSGFKWI